MLLEMLDSRVRGQAAVTSIIDTKLLAIIPYIETQAELKIKKRIFKTFKLVVVLLVALILIAAIVHFFVTPLDVLLARPK